MSRQLINEYRADLDRLRAVSGSKREGVLSEAFKDLLRRWGKSNDLVFVSQHGIVTKKGNRIYTDGALLHSLRVPFGYWEAKDEDDDLEREIEAKFRSGYPKDNIIFSDDRLAVLFQDGVTEANQPKFDPSDYPDRWRKAETVPGIVKINDKIRRDAQKRKDTIKRDLDHAGEHYPKAAVEQALAYWKVSL